MVSESQARRRRLLDALLRGEGDLPRAALRRDHDPRVPHGVLVVCGPGNREGVARALAGRVRQAVQLAAAEALPPHAVVVVPAGAPLAWEEALRAAERAAAGSGCLVLARPPVTGLRALRAAYHRAVSDAGLALAMDCPGPLVSPRELVVPRMLSLLDSADQRLLLTPLLRILALPAAHRDTHLRTLEALHQFGGSHPEVARELHLHPNTVRYRVERIQELTGMRLDHPADRLALDLAVALVRLRGRAALGQGGGDDENRGFEGFGLDVLDAVAAAHRGVDRAA